MRQRRPKRLKMYREFCERCRTFFSNYEEERGQPYSWFCSECLEAMHREFIRDMAARGITFTRRQ